MAQFTDHHSTAQPSVWLPDVLGILRSRWWIIPVCVLLCWILATAYTISAPKLYEARIVIMPKQQQSQTSGALQNLAGLAGFDVGGNGSNRFSLFMATLDSTRLTERLDQKYGLIKEIYPEQWDDQTKQWREPGGLVEAFKRALYGFFGLPAWVPPTSRALSDDLVKRVHKDRDKDTSSYSLTYQNRDPQLATRVLQLMYAETEDMLREDQLRQAESSIAYINQRLQAVSINDYRTMLIGFLAEQERDRMVLENRSIPVAAINVDPVTATDKPISPKPVIVFLVATVVGLLLAPILVLGRLSLTHGRRRHLHPIV